MWHIKPRIYVKGYPASFVAILGRLPGSATYFERPKRAMSNSIKHIPFADTWADDTRAVTLQGERVLTAWSMAKLDDEQAYYALFNPAVGWGEPHRITPTGHSSRPSLSSNGQLTALGCLTLESSRTRAHLRVLDEDAQVRFSWTSPTQEASFTDAAVAMSPDGATTWLAATRVTSSKSDLVFWTFSGSELITEQVLDRGDAICRTPALLAHHGGCAICWSEAPAIGQSSTILFATIESLNTPQRVDPLGERQAAPTMARDATSNLVIAWHEHVGDGRRWLAAARHDGDRFTRIELSTPPTITRVTSSTDQGWEFPTLWTAPNGGGCYLSGRSAHNFFVTRLDKPAERYAQIKDGWGGTGRYATLFEQEGVTAMIRREKRGIVIEDLALGDVHDPARPAPTGTHEVPPPKPPSLTQFAPGDRVPEAFAQIFFGDPHQHSSCSDGTGSIEEILDAAATRGLDFTALTDHDRFCKKAIGPLTWHLTCAHVDFFNSPDSFAVLHAYEFTGARPPGPGHKNIYFLDSIPTELPDHTWPELEQLLAEHPAVVIPHHVGFTGDDLEHHDPGVQPIWEICSVHGVYEQPDQPGPFPPRPDYLIPDQTLRQALEAGHRFGFCAGTDNHGLMYHHGVTPRRDPGSTGLTAVFGSVNRREAIVSAMARRHTYATSGAKILIALTVDGSPMGSRVSLSGPTKLDLWVRGTDNVEAITLVRHGQDQDLTFTIDEGGLIRITETLNKREVSEDFVYIRVVQRDGDMAWTSPIELSWA